MKRTRRGLTLVELLVAVALGVILVGVISFVWMQSNRIFTSTVNRLETYQRLRVLLDTVERDLANTARTTEMEWYDDVDDNGFWTTNDRLYTHGGTAGNPNTAVAPAFRAPADTADPLSGAPEFGANQVAFNNFVYFFAPFVLSPDPYTIDVEDYLTERQYWRDEVMVRTFALADGVNRPALVHYRLVQPAPGQRSVLRRRMWYLNDQGLMVAPPGTATSPMTDRFSLLAEDVCDFKVAFFFKESAGSQTGSSQANGYWYDVGHDYGGAPQSDTGAAGPTPGDPHDELLRADRDQGYIKAMTQTNGTTTVKGLPLSSQHHNFTQWSDPNNPDSQAAMANYNAVAFFYHGVARIELDQGRAMLRTISQLASPQPPTNAPGTWPAADFGWGGTKEPTAGRTYLGYDTTPNDTYTNFDFPGVRPGDKIFLYDATDDDGSWLDTVLDRDVNGNTILDDPSPPGTAGMHFRNKEYTVEVITSDGTQNYIALRLVEPINFYRLRRHWLAVEPTYDITVSPAYSPTNTSYAVSQAIGNRHGPDRNVQGSFNVRYRVGFLPAAFRVRLSIDDKFNRKVLPMERVIRLIQH